jgi:hypothetical protein
MSGCSGPRSMEQEINALMRRSEILDAQEDKRYGKQG